jgi:hypothetical protein
MASRIDMHLENRVDRLESIDAIRQLASKYALTLDMRNLDQHVNLFVSDVSVGKHGKGRQALKIWANDTFRNQFSGTSHHIGNHIIEFLDKDNAIGVVYSKNEHETEDEWVIMQMLYWDTYVRVDGSWLFKKRLPMYWYATDINKPPLGDNKMRWPGREPYEGHFHDLFPSWKRFWDSDYNAENDVAEPAPAEQFLEILREGISSPDIRVR